MKKDTLLLICSFLFFIQYSYSQNVGIGTTVPSNKLHVIGNFLVNAPYTATNTPPTHSQTKTMINNTTITFSSNDSTGRIYDPGGPTGTTLNLFAKAEWK
ncbi:MAG: hypothetical protein ABIQ02_11765 [Saprospiraceae bacterium]